MKAHLRELVAQALLDLRRVGKIPADFILPDFVIERTKSREHGDYASNIALLLGKRLGVNPMVLAESLVASMGVADESKPFEKVSIAKPGFINFTLSRRCVLSTVRRIIEQGLDYGKQAAESRESMTVEFVSANPNGPLHVGHGRGAAYGASVANLLEAVGHSVQREYYVNDAGRQMDILSISIWIRYHELCGVMMRFPDNGYKGDYVVDIARSLRAQQGDRLRFNANDIFADVPADESLGGDKEKHVDGLIANARQLLGTTDYQLVFQAGLDWCLGDIRNDLHGFGVDHNNFFSERSLSTGGYVDRAIAILQANGHLYEQDGATWFRSTSFGDDKDRVIIRDNGVSTYFASDLGYLLSKFERGFERALYILGADHHGYIVRLKAAAQGLGLDAEKVEIQLVQFAILYRGAERVQMSTRAGSFVTLRELREEVGKDAARYFYVMRSNEQHLDFDLELAKSHSKENPVYYIQYAITRAAGLFRKLKEKQWSYNDCTAIANRELLSTEFESILLNELMRLPEVIESAAHNRAPQILANYLRETANAFHSFYENCDILSDDEKLRQARLGLCKASSQVLTNGLALLGVSAPERM
ncbi:MAG: arginine--tRNA ligase [Arenimonas sp.]|nr:arginine--tRNA ligase [Arenimonas sp.]MBP6309747.1 arginine--tRNA ligase [Arenimonas sp.]